MGHFRTMNSLFRLGTSAIHADGSPGLPYPGWTPDEEYLTEYATQFDSIEVDCTYYRVPPPSVIRGWYDHTPDDFLFTAKVPRKITHEKVLVNCDSDFMEFLKAMDGLGEKLGPLLLQFGYFSKKVIEVNEFLGRLVPFLKNLPKERRFAVEIRNRNWLIPGFIEALRERGVALVLVDQMAMPKSSQWFQNFDPITADFTYVRWIGDRKGIEEWTKVWDHIMIDRTRELSEWVEVLKSVYDRRIQILAFAHNHYAGSGSGTIEEFRKLWNEGDKGGRVITASVGAR